MRPILHTCFMAAFLVLSSAAVGQQVQFKVLPAELSECAAPIVATLAWDAQASGVSKVKLFAVKDGVETLFTFTAAQGEIKTGPWVTSGTSFLMKDETETKVLGRVSMQRTKC